MMFEESKSRNRSIDDRTRFNLHISPKLGHKTIDELTSSDLDALTRRMEKAGRAPQTIKHVLTLLKRLLNFAIEKELIESIPGRLRITMPTVDNCVTKTSRPNR